MTDRPKPGPIVGDTLATVDAVVAALRSWQLEAERANALQARIDKIKELTAGYRELPRSVWIQVQKELNS